MVLDKLDQWGRQWVLCRSGRELEFPIRLIGELDEWGGHCGRADDYHHHTAPLHLSKTVGGTTPIAYALDGYPLYGSLRPNGKPVAKLDDYNGHTYKGKYHDHLPIRQWRNARCGHREGRSGRPTTGS